MRSLKITALTVAITLTMLLAGCNLFPQERTRPAPIRPNPNPAPQNRQVPTKNIPGMDSLSEKDLLQRITAVETAVKKNNWSQANRAGNSLGVDMARYRPDAPDGKSLRDMTRFDLIYTKLQADLKTRNKTGCLKDLQNLRNEMKSLDKGTSEK